MRRQCNSVTCLIPNPILLNRRFQPHDGMFGESSSQSQGTRLKVILACDPCRRKKAKCDGVQPICSRCSWAGSQCQYQTIIKKRGPPRGNIEVIESRLHRIELLRRRESAERKDGEVGGVSQPDFALLKSETTMPISEPLVNSYEESPTPASVENANKDQNREFIESTQASSIVASTNFFLYSVLNAVGQLQLNYMAEGHDSSRLLTNGDPSTSDFPLERTVPQELSNHLVNNFFHQFNFIFPILSRPHFMHQLQTDPTSIDPLLLNAIYATGSRYSDSLMMRKNFSRPETAGELFFKRCEQLLLTQFGQPSICTIQGLVILSWYLYLGGRTDESYMHRNLAMQHILALNLLRDPEQLDPSMKIVDMETRRRAFWALLAQDRWAAAMMSSSLSVNERDYDCKVPILEDDELWELTLRNEVTQKPMEGTLKDVKAFGDFSKTVDFLVHPFEDKAKPTLNLNEIAYTPGYYTSVQVRVFAETINLTRIIEKINQNLYAPSPLSLTAMETSLKQWFLNLPPYMKYEKPADDTPSSPVPQLFCMLYHATRVLLYKSNVKFYEDGIGGDHLTSSTTEPSYAQEMGLSVCEQAASSITHIAEQMVKHGQSQFLYNVFLFPLTLSASVHFGVVCSGSPQFNVAAWINLRKTIVVLKHCSRSCLSANDFTRVFEDVLQRCGVNLKEEKGECSSDVENDSEWKAGKRRLEDAYVPVYTSGIINDSAMANLAQEQEWSWQSNQNFTGNTASNSGGLVLAQNLQFHDQTFTFDQSASHDEYSDKFFHNDEFAGLPFNSTSLTSPEHPTFCFESEQPHTKLSDFRQSPLSHPPALDFMSATTHASTTADQALAFVASMPSYTPQPIQLDDLHVAQPPVWFPPPPSLEVKPPQKKQE
ncbi:fungal-specific transcription factor domain-containing protein, partial [Endogone sp. FLAS-F59071]